MPDEASASGVAPSGRPKAWRRFLAWLVAFEEAMDTTRDDVQDRRILALEREVARLRSPPQANSRR